MTIVISAGWFCRGSVLVRMVCNAKYGVLVENDK